MLTSWQLEDVTRDNGLPLLPVPETILESLSDFTILIPAVLIPAAHSKICASKGLRRAEGRRVKSTAQQVTLRVFRRLIG